MRFSIEKESFSMDDASFSQLMDKIYQETGSVKKKIDLLYMSKGKFDSRQAATLLKAIGPISKKFEVIQILASRLCQMTCGDAREILLAVTVHSDLRLDALNHIKRYLSDNQTDLGQEYILSVFPYETSKQRALQILSTVNSTTEKTYSSGGHQVHAPLGTVTSQAIPLKEYYYGPVTEQMAKAKSPPSNIFASRSPQGQFQNMAQPSYAYPEECTYTAMHGLLPNHLVSPPRSLTRTRTHIPEGIGGSSRGAASMSFHNIESNKYPIGADYI